jgi:hypothetical protein
MEKKQKKVKAWAVLGGNEAGENFMEPMPFGDTRGRGGSLSVFYDKKKAQEMGYTAWQVVPCTITYDLP